MTTSVDRVNYLTIAVSYQIATRWLFFLSFLHVLLELPLNHVTFVNILSGLRMKRVANPS